MSFSSVGRTHREGLRAPSHDLVRATSRVSSALVSARGGAESRRPLSPRASDTVSPNPAFTASHPHRVPNPRPPPLKHGAQGTRPAHTLHRRPRGPPPGPRRGRRAHTRRTRSAGLAALLAQRRERHVSLETGRPRARAPANPRARPSQAPPPPAPSSHRPGNRSVTSQGPGPAPRRAPRPSARARDRTSDAHLGILQRTAGQPRAQGSPRRGPRRGAGGTEVNERAQVTRSTRRAGM